MMAIIRTSALADTVAALGQPPVKSVGEDIYIVMFVTLIVWGGVFFYLLYLDRKLKAIRERMKIDELSEQ